MLVAEGVAAVRRPGELDEALVVPVPEGLVFLKYKELVAAISGRGHARFWLGVLPDGRDVVVLGHRFGYGLRHGYDQLVAAPAVRHYLCDNPLCQNVDHLRLGTNGDNAHDWATRRHTPGSPLRDTRGALGRARALRAAARLQGNLSDAADAGLNQLDRDQPPLLDLPPLGDGPAMLGQGVVER